MDKEQLRSSDLLIGQLMASFDSLRETIEHNENRASEWRGQFDARLKPLELMAERFDGPVKIIFAAIWVIIVGILTALGLGISHWFEKHWN